MVTFIKVDSLSLRNYIIICIYLKTICIFKEVLVAKLEFWWQFGIERAFCTGVSSRIKWKMRQCFIKILTPTTRSHRALVLSVWCGHCWAELRLLQVGFLFFWPYWDELPIIGISPRSDPGDLEASSTFCSPAHAERFAASLTRGALSTGKAENLP